MAQETGVRSLVKSYQKNGTLLNTQHYKERIKAKEEQSKERSSALPYTSVL